MSFELLIAYRAPYEERDVPRGEIIRAKERARRWRAVDGREVSSRPGSAHHKRDISPEERAWLAEALRCDDEKATAPEA